MPEIMRVLLILSRSNCVKIVSLEQILSEESEDEVVGKRLIKIITTWVLQLMNLQGRVGNVGYL
jgi:hypothetical protein